MNSSSRVIVNTGFLYLNMLVSLAVQLVSVRILLAALGDVDYGIYMVVAGVVALFAFMNVAMAAATQRYLSFSIGKGDKHEISEIFYQSVVLHMLIGAVFVVVLETGGIFYVTHILQAPVSRLTAALVLLHCITASTFVNIITVPYEADINANEDMGVIAGINIFDALLKLSTALIVLYVSYDKLKVFGTLTMVSLIITLTLKRIYCVRHYPEARIRWHRIVDYRQMRDVASFAGWNLLGAGCSLARYQGTAMILNAFFGIIINTAYGVAQQVNGLLLFFANTIVRAIRPQVVKSEGSGDRQRMLRLSVTTCKVTALMVALMAIPLGLEMPSVLEFWLGRVPIAESVMFCQCFLLIVFINQLTIGIQIAIESTGRIWILQSIVGMLHIVALPLGWICFRMGYPPVAIMLCVIGEEIVSLFLRLLIARYQVGLNMGSVLLREILPCVLLAVLIVVVLTQVNTLLPSGRWAHMIMVILLSTTLLLGATYGLLLHDYEKRVINSFVGKIGDKFVRRSLLQSRGG